MAWEEKLTLKGPPGDQGPPGTPRTVNGVEPAPGSDDILLRPSDINTNWILPPGSSLTNPSGVYGSGWNAALTHGMRQSLISGPRSSGDPTYNSVYSFDAWWCGDTNAVGGDGFRGWYPVNWDVIGDSTLRTRIQTAANHPDWNRKLRGVDKYPITVRDPFDGETYKLLWDTNTSSYRWSVPGTIAITSAMLGSSWSLITGPQYVNQVQIDGQFAHLYFVISRSGSSVSDIIQLPPELAPATGTGVPIGSGFSSTSGSMLLLISSDARVYVPGNYWHGSIASNAAIYGYGTWKVSGRY